MLMLKAVYKFVCLGLLVLLVPLAHVTPVAAQTQLIKLSTNNRVGRLLIVQGSSETIRVDIPFSEIVVGDPETADVNPLTDQTMYVLGRKLGLTNVALFDAEKKLVGVIDVEVTHDLEGLKRALRASLRNSNIKVRSINGRILLEGMVRSTSAAERAMSLASEFAVNADGSPGRVSNSLTIASNQQVNLEVRFVEVNRTAGKELGLNWNSLVGDNTTFRTGSGVAGGGELLGALSNTVPFGTFVAKILTKGIAPDLLITALEQKRLARRLAEPNLTAMSGEEAEFHAGGEFPIPVGQDNGRITIAFKEFGVKLKFTPIVMDDGIINLKIAPEVSEIDSSNSIRLTEGGILIPALSTRKAKTSVELRDGQSFAIAGLLQTVNQKVTSQLPWLGDVPVLGTLFRSSSFQKKQSDLVIIVTPRLVVPVGNRQQLQTPLDTSLSSNEPEFFLLGKQEVSRKKLDVKYHGVYGHIIDLPKVDYGKPSK